MLTNQPLAAQVAQLHSEECSATDEKASSTDGMPCIATSQICTGSQGLPSITALRKIIATSRSYAFKGAQSGCTLHGSSFTLQCVQRNKLFSCLQESILGADVGT